MTRITLAVPCWNEGAQVEGLIQSLRSLDPQPDQLLIVDDGSTDGCGDRLRAAGLDVVRHDKNQGLSAARNTARRAADAGGSTIIAYIDADARPSPGHVARVRAAFADPGLSGFGGPNLDLGPVGAADKVRARFWAQWLGPSPLDPAPMLVGANAAYRLSALAAVSGFDPLFRTHGEDVDVGRRLRRAGLRLRYDPQHTVVHARVDGPRTLARMAFRHCQAGILAARQTPELDPTPRRLSTGFALRAASAPAAALVRRGDPVEAALAALAAAAGIAGHVAGWTGGR